MNALGLLYSASIALIITIFFAYALRIYGPWGNFWTFFLILLLAVLAANLWVRPIGPSFQGIYWIPPIAAGFLVASILAASTPSSKPFSRLNKNPKDYMERKANAMALGAFFWFVVVFMFVLVIMGLFAGS
jgi:hypothetical protein